MAIFVPWLADAARMTGYPVVEERDWRSRGAKGYGMRLVEGVVGHHTAGSATGEYPSRGIILNGRTGLPGPLANFGLGRSGTVYVVAAGRANHAGDSQWAGYTDLNDEFLGIEAEDNGDGTWTQAQMDCYPRLVAALLHYMRRNESRYAAHRDIALPLGRKPDPAGIDSNWMRTKVRAYLASPASINKNAQPPLVGEEEFVFRSIRNVDDGRIALVGPNYFKALSGPQWEAAKAGGVCNLTPDEVNTVEYDQIKFVALRPESL